MRKNKMGSLFLISVLALAGIGISYAGWTDTITVTGTVATGDVDINIVALSGTWVYKLVDIHEDFYWHGWADPTTGDPIDDIDAVILGETGYDGAYFLVAYGTAKLGTEDDTIEVIYDNLFPCKDFIVDAVFHYDGSVPARVSVNTWDYIITGEDPDTDWVAPLMASGDIYGHMYYTDDPTPYLIPELMPDLGTVDIGSQFEFCDYVKVDLHIHLPQDNFYMKRGATITYEIEVIQWNQFGENAGGCGEEPLIGHNADVMLCLDRSGSIAFDPLVPPIVRTAAKGFISAILSPDNGMIGIASFASSGSLDHILSKNEGTLHTVINNIVFSGSTDLAGGMSFARTELQTNDRTPDSNPDPALEYPDYMVIVTDGEPNVGATPIADAEAEAAAAKAHGIRIFVFGIGSELTAATKNWLQNTIASSPSDYYEGDWTVLEDLLEGLV